MTDENLSPVVTAQPRRRVFVALLAIVTIVITARAIWLQLPSVLPARGETAGSNTRSTRREPSFDMSKSTIPVERIMGGGPPKDGIPALTDAKFVSAAGAQFMTPDDRVIGVALAGEAKAYPLKILDRHEVVNDRLASRSIAVTYCPLCDSSVVFERQYGDEVIEFGVSGLLFNSNVLLYDRIKQGARVKQGDRAKQGPESLWSQMASAAVTSAKSGQPLKRLPLEVTSWSDWAARHPNTLVLSTETGHQRDYNGRAYQSYFSNPRLMFPVEPLDDRLPLKTPVLGVIGESSQRAYALPGFAQLKGGQFDDDFEDDIDGQRITLHYDPEHESLRVVEAAEGLEWMYSFWFAWSAFYPETDIYQPQ